MTQPAKPVKSESFEKNVERLDAIVRQLEDAELPLERALQLYEEGMKLSEVCAKNQGVQSPQSCSQGCQKLFGLVAKKVNGCCGTGFLLFFIE